MTSVTERQTREQRGAEAGDRLDGNDLGAPRTAAPYTTKVDPKGLAAGAHALSVTARDLDGNETLVEVKFKTK